MEKQIKSFKELKNKPLYDFNYLVFILINVSFEN